VWQEILGDEDILTELDLSDDYESQQMRLLVYQTADSEPQICGRTETGVTVDFNKSFIQLKKV